MKAAAILIIIGLATAASAHAEATDGYARAAALLSSASTLKAIVPAVTLPSTTPGAAVDAQTRAANLLQRPIQNATASSVPAEERNRMTGAAPDAHGLARRLLGHSA